MSDFEFSFCQTTKAIKVKGKHESDFTIPYAEGLPVRGTLILRHRHSEVRGPVPFLATFNFPSIAIRYPSAPRLTVGDHPDYDQRVRLTPSSFSSDIKYPGNIPTAPINQTIALLFGQKWLIFITFQSAIKISQLQFWSFFGKIPRL